MNMPSVSVHDLRVQPDAGDLIVGSHGRGAFIFDDLAPIEGLASARQAGNAGTLSDTARIRMVLLVGQSIRHVRYRVLCSGRNVFGRRSAVRGVNVVLLAREIGAASVDRDRRRERTHRPPRRRHERCRSESRCVEFDGRTAGALVRYRNLESRAERRACRCARNVSSAIARGKNDRRGRDRGSCRTRARRGRPTTTSRVTISCKTLDDELSRCRRRHSTGSTRCARTQSRRERPGSIR